MKNLINKHKNIIIVCILFIIITLITTVIFIEKKKENNANNNEELIFKAIGYIVKEKKENGYGNNEEDYQVFIDYHLLGIDEKDNEKYVYMWVLVETCYVKDKELRISERSSMLPYKFTLKNNIIINSEIPKDGGMYEASTRKIFPKKIAKKILSYKAS